MEKKKVLFHSSICSLFYWVKVPIKLILGQQKQKHLDFLLVPDGDLYCRPYSHAKKLVSSHGNYRNFFWTFFSHFWARSKHFISIDSLPSSNKCAFSFIYLSKILADVTYTSDGGYISAVISWFHMNKSYLQIQWWKFRVL